MAIDEQGLSKVQQCVVAAIGLIAYVAAVAAGWHEVTRTTAEFASLAGMTMGAPPWVLFMVVMSFLAGFAAVLLYVERRPAQDGAAMLFLSVSLSPGFFAVAAGVHRFVGGLGASGSF